MSQCPLCLTHTRTHDTTHLFNCSQVPTQHNTISLWKKPLEVAEVSKSGNLDWLLGEIKGWLLQNILGGGGNNSNTKKIESYVIQH